MSRGLVGAADDVRARADGIGWVTRSLFADERLVVTAGPRPAAPDAQLWAIVPSLSRARFLIPLGNRRVAAASMLAYNGLRSGPTRAVRSVLGTLARAGATSALPFPVLSVAGPAELSPITWLAGELGNPALVAAIGVRPPDPNRKPTLQLFDASGRPRGYAKVGWNDATRALVRAESAALRAVSAYPGLPLVPQLLHAGEWADRTIGVTAPLPGRLRRLSDPDKPRLAAMLAVARRGGGPGVRQPLAGSSYLAQLRATAEQVPGPEGAALRTALDRLTTTADKSTSGDAIEFGDWHGDWVPWNLGELPGPSPRLVAWDWEHSGSGVPVGFDLAHQVFTTALVVGGRPAAEAAKAAEQALRRHGDALGVPAGSVPDIVACYLAEMWLRAFRMASGGAGWNADLHPALLEVLARK